MELLGNLAKDFFESVSSNAVPLALALAYIVAKISIKMGARGIVRDPINPGEVIAWFGVDAAALSLTFSAGAEITKTFTKDGAVMWYFLLIFCLIMTVLAYTLFLKGRKAEINAGWRRKMMMSSGICMGLFFGGAPLLGTASVMLA